ncbi:MAG TPA: ABC transporter permease [Galbitalea sp.]|jgi:peptide/nickel transport system permease protein|nr:ABC transporter permease [Galbitalea sp.]
MSSLIPPTSRGGSSLDEDPSESEPRLGDTDASLPLGKVDESRAENAIELKEVEGLSQGTIVLRRFFRHRGAMISLTVLVLVIILALSSEGLDLLGINIPGWWKWRWTTLANITNGGQPTLSIVPQWLGGPGIRWGDHPFGQDSLGRDMFAEVMRGSQLSLMIVFVVGIAATFIGVVVGAVAGFFRGWVDSVLMRLTDVVLIIPLIVLTATLAHTYAASGAIVVAIVLALASWPQLARLVRGDVLGLREREFVDAARVAGASNSRIMFVHILPNAIGVIVVNTTLLMAATILTEAALGFLGFGVQPPDVSLGSIIYQYENAFDTRPWLFFWPAIFVIIIALTVNFIGDGLRDAFDPRQKRALNKAARKSAAAARAKVSVRTQ